MIMRKTIWIEPKLVFKIDDVRARERPIPSFGAMCNRLMWLGLSGYKAPAIDYERVPLLEAPKLKYCDECGSKLPIEGAKFCDSCGVKVYTI